MLPTRDDAVALKAGVRRTNLAVVNSWLESARAGRPTAGLIAGRAGMGKTVLARQATLVARHLECDTATAAGRSTEAPSMVTMQLCEQLKVPPAASDALQVRALREELKRSGARGRCTLLLFEDIQDLAPADLALVEDLVLFPPSPRLLVLLTQRTHGEPADHPALRLLDRLEAARTLEVLTLVPMTEAEAAPLVAGGFPPGAVTPRFVRDAVAFTGGNPQWIDSLVRETLKMPEGERAALLTGSQLLTDALMPASITRAVEFRLAAQAAARPVAEALAVWGAPTTIETLASLLSEPEAAVEAGVERLERAGILAADDGAPPLVLYDFVEPIVAASLRTLMPRTARLRLQRASLARGDQAGPRREGDPAVHALRYLEAAEVLGTREVEGILAAARSHIERSRFEAARSLLGRLVERLRAAEYPVPAEALVLLAESHSRAGAFDEAARILAQTSEHADDAQERRRLMRSARDAVAIGRDADALATYERLLADEGLAPVERAHILLDAARVDSSLGRPDMARRRRASAGRFAESGGDQGLAGIARLEEALVSVLRGQHVSLRDVSRAFGQAWASQTRGISARATSNVAYVLADCTTLHRAARWWRRAMRLAEQHEDYAALSSIAVSLARTELELGEWREAEETIATAIHIDASLHRTRALRGSRGLQSLLSAFRGQTGALDLQLDDTFRGAERFGGPAAMMWDFLARFGHRMRLGQLEQAEETLLRGKRLITETLGQERMVLVDVLPREAWLYYRMGNLERLQVVIEQFEVYAEQSGRTLPVLRPLTYQMHAYRWVLQGDPSHAADLSAAAADRFAALGYHWREGLVRRDAGDANREAGFAQEAKIQYEAAFRLFDAMGAVEQLGYVRQEMASLGVRARRSTQRRSTLTARQWQIAELAARGLSDPQVAETLGISKRTASTHMHHILQALGLQSRVQLEDWIAAHQRDRAAALGDMM